jgi:hypothetical protein
MGNQKNKQKNVNRHLVQLVEFVEIIEPFKGERFVIDDEFKDDDNEEKDFDPLLLTWQPRKKTQSIMARKL